MADDVSVAAVEEALRLAATSMHEQLAAIDEAITYHETRAKDLRDTRKKVARVEAIVNGTDGRQHNDGMRNASPEAKQRLAERTRQRHAEERELKKQRVREYVLAMPPGVDVIAAEIAPELNDASMAKNHPLRLGVTLANVMLAELRDEGTLRLDRTGMGGQQVYRVVGT